MASSILTKPMAINLLLQAKRLLFFENLSESDIGRWEIESFVFSKTMTYGLNQSQGGPCGVFAAVQAYIIETLLYQKSIVVSDKDKNEELSQRILSIALAKILVQARRRTTNDKTSSSIVVVTLRKNEAGDNNGSSDTNFSESNLVINTNFDHNENNSNSESNINNASEVASVVDQVATCIFENISSYQNKGGILLFLYSVIATRGVQTIKDDMDDPTQRLTLEHGHCSQELLNLLLCGYATSQVHDGNIAMGDTGLTLNGVQNTPRVGYLTYLEALRYCTVGEFYKTPQVPIWVVGSDSHFTVLFATNIKVGQDTPEEKNSKLLRRIFNKYDVSGGGFVQAIQLQQILQDLKLLNNNDNNKIHACIDALAKELDVMGTGIILWNDFDTKLVRLMVEGTDIVEKYGSMGTTTSANTAEVLDNHASTGQWTCGVCTFINETALITACAMCGSLKPASPKINFPSDDFHRNANDTVVEPDLKRIKRNENGDVTTTSASTSKSIETYTDAGNKVNDNGVDDEDISDFNGFPLFHYNGLTGLVKGVERGVVLTKCIVYKRVDIIGLKNGSSSGGMNKNRIDEVIRTKFKGCEIEWDGDVGNING